MFLNSKFCVCVCVMALCTFAFHGKFSKGVSLDLQKKLLCFGTDLHPQYPQKLNQVWFVLWMIEVDFLIFNFQDSCDLYDLIMFEYLCEWLLEYFVFGYFTWYSNIQCNRFLSVHVATSFFFWFWVCYLLINALVLKYMKGRGEIGQETRLLTNPRCYEFTYYAYECV